MYVGIIYYAVGRQNKLNAHFGEDHTFVVLDGQETFYNKYHQLSVLNKGEAIMLPVGTLYYFGNSGDKPLALLRVSALKGKPEFTRVDAEGNKRTDVDDKYISVDGEPIPGQFWELS
jgi:mannose-6-phosphate isomerase-like protein (cupin superfamily)